MSVQIKEKYLTLLRQVVPASFREDGSALRLDAGGESVIVQRALDHVEKTVTETLYAELRALKFVPMIPGIDPGARSYTFLVEDRVGRAVATGDRGKSLPRVDVSLSEHTSAVKIIGTSYSYTTQELREVAKASKFGPSIQLDQMRANVATDVIARDIDSIVAFGSANDSRIKGFLNNSSVTVDSAAKAWEDMSPEELLEELKTLANTQVIVSKEVFSPDTILLPTKHMLIVSGRSYGLAANETVLSFFLEKVMKATGRQMSVDSWPLLATADAARTGPRAVAYKRHVDVAGSIVPIPFIAHSPQPVELEWVTPCEASCGGTAVKQPLGMFYYDGLDG